MPPTVHSIRSGDDEDFAPGQHPLQPGRSSLSEGLRLAQQHYDQFGYLDPQRFPNMRVENGRVVDDRSWWERNNWWAIPAAAIGTAGIGSAFAGGAGAAAGGGAAGGSAASQIPFGVGPTVFGAGGGAGTAAAGLTPGLLAENAAAGGSVPLASNLMRNGAAAGNGLSDWLNPRNLAGLAAAGGSALSGLREPAGQGQLEDLFKLAMERSRAAGPLFDQLLTQTRAQMPAYTRGE